MNAASFTGYIRPFWESKTVSSLSDAADVIATGYHLSNIGQTTTLFGAPLINADKSILKTFVELGLSINFYAGQTQSSISTIVAVLRATALGNINSSSAKSIINPILTNLASSLPLPLSFISAIISSLVDTIFNKIAANQSPTEDIRKLDGMTTMLDVSKLSYTVMSVGVCMYWLTSFISPIPPMPPCISPTAGTLVLFPGLPIPLNSDLTNTFKINETVDAALIKLYNSFISHQFTVGGIYNGIIPMFPAPIPGPPIPWIGVLNIPLPQFKVPKVLDKDGDGKKDADSSSNRSGKSGSGSGGGSSKNQGGSGTAPTNSGTSLGGTSQGGSTSNSGGTSTSPNSGGSNTGSSSAGTSQGGQSSGTGSGAGSGSSSASKKSDGNYNNNTSIANTFTDTVNSVLDSSNPYGLKIDNSGANPSFLELVIIIRESVVQTIDGSDNYQFAIAVQLNSLAQNLQLGGSVKNLPTSVGESIKYSFKDTVKTDKSIYADSIVSPKLRALELMREPQRNALLSVIGTQLPNYIEKWYGGTFPPQLRYVSVYVTTAIDADEYNDGFTRLSKFNTL